MNDHMHIGALESAALTPSDFELFVARCVKLCSSQLHMGHDGKPSFDGDQETDGYSLDWLHEQFGTGARPLDVLHRLLWRKRRLHVVQP